MSTGPTMTNPEAASCRRLDRRRARRDGNQENNGEAAGDESRQPDAAAHPVVPMHFLLHCDAPFEEARLPGETGSMPDQL